MAASESQIDALIAAIRSRAELGDDEATIAFGNLGGEVEDPTINDSEIEGTYDTGTGIQDTSGGANAMKSLLQGVADWLTSGNNFYLRNDGLVVVLGSVSGSDSGIDANQVGSSKPAFFHVNGSAVFGKIGDSDSNLSHSSIPGYRVFVGGDATAWQIALEDGDGAVNLCQNAYHNGTNYRAVNGGVQPNRLRIDEGDFTFYNVSGAAPASDGDAITWAPILHVGQSANNVGVATDSPSASYALDVNGGIQATAFDLASDSRFKEGVEDLTDVVSRLKKVRGVTYSWNDTYKELFPNTTSEGREIGVIAQELEEVFPEIVNTWIDRNQKQWKSVNYPVLSAVLIEAVKELDNRLVKLEMLCKTL